MIRSHLQTATSFLLGALAGIILVARVHAEAERVAFPEFYAQGVKWLAVDRAERKEVIEFYAMPAAIEAARNGQGMPNGTVFTLVRYAAQLDAQGNPRRGADGHYVKGEIVGYGVMEKRNGWGNARPESLRNGDWEYRAFTAEKVPNRSVNLAACFECHKSEAAHDFVHAYEKLGEASR